MSTKDLINAIIVGDAAEIQNAFQSTMAEKISAQLEIRRQEVAQNLFKTESTVVAEQSEQLDELSKTTLKSYVKKASGGLHGAARHAFDAGKHLALGNDAETDKSFAKSRKRISGIEKAVDKLTKEEQEVELDEGLADDFLATVKKTNPNAKLAGSVADRKKERDDMIAKREKESAGKPKEEPKAHKEKYPLGGYDPKSGRSYSEEVEHLVVTNIESALYAMQEGRNVLDESLDEAVSTSSKNNYEYTHGKKPKGYGNWFFSTVHPKEHHPAKHKDQTVNVTGTFSDAAKKAQAHFKEKGHKDEIHVLT